MQRWRLQVWRQQDVVIWGARLFTVALRGNAVTCGGESVRDTATSDRRSHLDFARDPGDLGQFFEHFEKNRGQLQTLKRFVWMPYEFPRVGVRAYL